MSGFYEAEGVAGWVAEKPASRLTEKPLAGQALPRFELAPRVGAQRNFPGLSRLANKRRRYPQFAARNALFAVWPCLDLSPLATDLGGWPDGWRAARG